MNLKLSVGDNQKALKRGCVGCYICGRWRRLVIRYVKGAKVGNRRIQICSSCGRKNKIHLLRNPKR